MNPILRPWQLTDLESLLNYADNFNIANMLTNKFPHPYTKESGERFIDYAMQANPIQIFAITINNDAIGAIGIHPQDDIFAKNAELGYWIAEPFWGNGIATNVLQQIITYAYANFDIKRLFARPFGSNIASQKILEKAGFVLEASLPNTIFKNGRFEDELIYGLRKK